MIAEDENKARVDFEIVHATENLDSVSPNLRILVINPIPQEIGETGLVILNELLDTYKSVELLCISDNKKLTSSVTYSTYYNNTHVFYSPLEGFALCRESLNVLLDTAKIEVSDKLQVSNFVPVYKFSFLKEMEYQPPREKIKLLSLTKDIL